MLKGKRVLMYCTGGVRCEKATAFVRRVVPGAAEVLFLLSKTLLLLFVEILINNPNS